MQSYQLMHKKKLYPVLVIISQIKPSFIKENNFIGEAATATATKLMVICLGLHFPSKFLKNFENMCVAV